MGFPLLGEVVRRSVGEAEVGAGGQLGRRGRGVGVAVAEGGGGQVGGGEGDMW